MGRRKRRPVDEAAHARLLAKFYGFAVEDAEAARQTLQLRPDDFLIRFTELVSFARTYGLNVRALAEFVAESTSGIEPWVSPTTPQESAWQALVAGDLADAEARANQMLETAEAPEGRWKGGGDLSHHAHLVLGHIRLRQGDVAGAEEHLLAAGETPGSAPLNSFGPNMTLAAALLKLGRKDAVLEYFRECAVFWQSDPGRLAEWQEAVQRGEIPDFGPNLVYGGSKGLEI